MLLGSLGQDVISPGPQSNAPQGNGEGPFIGNCVGALKTAKDSLTFRF
jgi:hypothetical protein